MTYLLRHGAAKEGLTMDRAGYVQVSQLLANKTMQPHKLTEDHVCFIVAKCPKQRFQLGADATTGALLIRAAQGHTLSTVEAEELLTPLTPEMAAELPMVVHGTRRRVLPLIERDGLSRMARQHIHFATNLPGQGGVISGMRHSADALIEIDVQKAMADGYKFYLSSNNVVLSPGNEQGYIPPEYFKKVSRR